MLRVDAEFEIEGITIVGVVPSKEKRSEPERLEVLGPQRPPPPAVTSSLVSKGERRGRPDRGERKDRPDRGGRSDRPGRRPWRATGPRPRRTPGARPAANDRGVTAPGAPSAGHACWRGQTGGAGEAEAAQAQPRQHAPRRRSGRNGARAAAGGRAAPEGRPSRRPPGHRDPEQDRRRRGAARRSTPRRCSPWPRRSCPR